MTTKELFANYAENYLSKEANDFILTDLLWSKVEFLFLSGGVTATLYPNHNYVALVSGSNNVLSAYSYANDSVKKIGQANLLLVVPMGVNVGNGNMTLDGELEKGKINECKIKWWNISSNTDITLKIEDTFNLSASSFGNIKNALQSNLAVSSTALNSLFTS